MILRTLDDIQKSDRDIFWGNGKSRRFLLEKDDMGYSLTDTIVTRGTESSMQYINHLEACYCIEGSGEVEIDSKKYPIEPGTMYALDKNEAHILRAFTDMRLICVFNPPLNGSEKHNLTSDGYSSYVGESE